MTFRISPGVYSREKDISDYVPNVATSIGAIVGYSAKGNVDDIVLITNQQQFIAEYGQPELGEYFHYSALAFLEKGNQLYCYRVHNGALYGGVAISQSGSDNLAFSIGRSSKAYADDSEYPNALFYVTAKDPGTWNNDLGIRITNIDAANYEFDIEVYDLDDDGNYALIETFKVSRKDQKDGNGRQQYLEDRINGNSQYIYVADNTALADTVMPQPQATTLAMIGGAVGSAVSDSDVIAGWELFENPDDIDVRILINGGYTSVAVQTQIKTVAEGRRDCIAVLDVPYANLTSIASIVSWRDSTQNFNSSYCALYAPWIKIYDQYNDRLVEVPPSGYVASMYAYNDYIAEPWYAAAGFNRGVMNVLGFTDVFTEGERDTLYAAEVNPLQTFRGEGNVIWGQKTQATRSSALDRVNVRRMLIVLEKAIATMLRSFVFEPNSEQTRFRVTAVIEEYLDKLYSRGAFQAEAGDKGYRVLCNTTNNTAATIDANELHVDIFVKPSKAAEYIQLTTIISKTGASFDEIITRNVFI